MGFPVAVHHVIVILILLEHEGAAPRVTVRSSAGHREDDLLLHALPLFSLHLPLSLKSNIAKVYQILRRPDGLPLLSGNNDHAEALRNSPNNQQKFVRDYFVGSLGKNGNDEEQVAPDHDRQI